MKRIAILLTLSLISAPAFAGRNNNNTNNNSTQSNSGVTHNNHQQIENRNHYDGDSTISNSYNSTGLQELSIDNSNHAAVPSPVIADSNSVPTITFYIQKDSVGQVFGSQLTIPLK